MSLNTQMSNTLVSLQVQNFITACSSGTVTFYDGTQPANANTAVTTQHALVVVTFNTTAFSSSVNGVVSSPSFTAPGTGTTAAGVGVQPTWYRIRKSDGTTVVNDGSAGAASANAIIGVVSAGQSVVISNLTHTVLESSTGI